MSFLSCAEIGMRYGVSLESFGLGDEVPVNRHIYAHELRWLLTKIEADMRGGEEKILELLNGF